MPSSSSRTDSVTSAERWPTPEHHQGVGIVAENAAIGPSPHVRLASTCIGDRPVALGATGKSVPNMIGLQGASGALAGAAGREGEGTGAARRWWRCGAGWMSARGLHWAVASARLLGASAASVPAVPARDVMTGWIVAGLAAHALDARPVQPPLCPPRPPLPGTSDRVRFDQSMSASSRTWRCRQGPLIPTGRAGFPHPADPRPCSHASERCARRMLARLTRPRCVNTQLGMWRWPWPQAFLAITLERNRIRTQASSRVNNVMTSPTSK